MASANYIPVLYQIPTADSASQILSLIPLHSGEDVSGAHKLGALVALVIREVEKHIGPLNDQDRKRWKTAITGATHRLKDGQGCLIYRAPVSGPGGHGVYVFKDASYTQPSDLAPDERGESPDDSQPQAKAFVYAWCLPYYQQENRYPIKIGRTEGRPPQDRSLDSLTDLPEDPKILMEIPCMQKSTALHIESTLHHVLRARGHALRGENSAGKEWFQSNTSELRELLDFLYQDKLNCDWKD